MNNLSRVATIRFQNFPEKFIILVITCGRREAQI